MSGLGKFCSVLCFVWCAVTFAYAWSGESTKSLVAAAIGSVFAVGAFVIVEIQRNRL